MVRFEKMFKSIAVFGCLLLCFSSCSSGTSIYEMERDAKYEAAYEDGYKAGFDEGHLEGIADAKDSLNDTLHGIASDAEDEWGISPEEAIGLLDLYAEGESGYVSKTDLRNALGAVYQYYWESYYVMQEIDSYD